MNYSTGHQKLHCNCCLDDRLHTVLYRTDRQERYQQDERGYLTTEDTTYTLTSCNGCEYVTLRSHWTIDGTNDTYEQYPSKLTRRIPKWTFSLFMHSTIDGFSKFAAFHELYRSIGAGNSWLTVLGVRALLEHIMIEKVGDHKRFDKNLDEFQKQGFISQLQRNALEQVIKAGHAGMHRGFQPKAVDVERIMDILENVIEAIYVSKDSASKLVIPPRS